MLKMQSNVCGIINKHIEKSGKIKKKLHFGGIADR